MKPRRIRISVAAAVVAVGALVAATTIRPAALSPELRIRGADISFTLQEEAINQTVSDNGTVAPIERILASHGANYVRLRLWVNPQGGRSDMNSTLELARRAHVAGLKLLLDLHYSDSWADRTTQQIPAAWQGQTQQGLRSTVETYSRDTVAALARQGTPADIVQIGNEVTHGMLWPNGRIYSPAGETWVGFADLIKAGIAGARAGNPNQVPLIMVHTDTGGDQNASDYFYDHLLQQGVSFDLIGLSYYPFWNGSLADLRQNLNSLTTRYNKDIIIAETAYPWTLSSSGGAPSVVSTAAALPDAAAYPATPQGQARYFAALNQILREVPNGRGAGYFIWEPGWLPGVPADERTGNAHSNLTLFDWWGHGLPALDAFRPTGGSGS
jgi:arabinogalactan endo-1,4-beta-galactosidase